MHQQRLENHSYSERSKCAKDTLSLILQGAHSHKTPAEAFTLVMIGHIVNLQYNLYFCCTYILLVSTECYTVSLQPVTCQVLGN